MILNKIRNVIKYQLVKDKISAYKNIDGWLTNYEALGLYSYASKLPVKSVIVEIGSWKGKSTYCLAKGLKSGKIYAIDPFDASGEAESAVAYNEKRGEQSLYEQFQSNMDRLGVSSVVTPMKGFSSDFVGKFPAIDLLFIDGDHSIQGCDFDYTNYSLHLKIGGYIAFHDYDVNRN
ncbi:MAG: class I SAM-dependent methyltransferase, partial [Flammeovirgaceae bacterium]